jgi:L-threonylcarbamoyladenylate synthase
MSLVVVNPQQPDAAIIARAAEVLRSGGLVAFPTETVYGLGASALSAEAVSKIFEAKGRPAWNPVIAHVANEEQARALTTSWPDSASKLARAFWPGPLTLVLPKRDTVPDIATAGLPAIGIRVPSHPVALALINALGSPIAAPSANRFTELSPTTAQHVANSLGDRVDMILDGGSSTVGIESTVIDLTGAVPVLLRPGVLTREVLEAALGVPIATASTETVADNIPRNSPGRVERHYSPRASVWLFEATDIVEIAGALAEHAPTNPSVRIAALIIDWSLELPATVLAVRMPGDAAAYARVLYATLHDLDAEGYSVVAIERPPVQWAGVRDRLERAAR